MLTPGEFVVRRAMVDKYGIPMLESINQGAFTMPRYNMGSDRIQNVPRGSSKTNINAPVYNAYSVNVPVTQPNASADEIAYKVMTKIQQAQAQQIRSSRGY
jgi:hypothetical protein